MDYFQDIYHVIGKELVDQNYWQLNIDGKKKLLNQELKRYLINKINDINGKEILLTETDFNVIDLLEHLVDNALPEQKRLNVDRLIHYVLNIAGQMQGYTITWWEEDDENLINLPHVEFNDKSLWSDLKTHSQTDCLITFNFVYEIFLNNVMKMSADRKEF